MRSTLAKVVLLATLPGWSGYCLGAGSPQSDNINMEAMTVAELEKAGDQARMEKDYNLAIDYFQAALRNDYEVMLGITVLVGVITVLGNLIADIGYAILDPRIRY